MKIIFSLSLLLLASSDCFSMKKRQLDNNNDLKNNKQFSQTNTEVTPLSSKGQKRYSTQENNQPNHKKWTGNDLNNQNDYDTQLQNARNTLAGRFQEQQMNPQFIRIFAKNGTYRDVPVNKNQN